MQDIIFALNVSASHVIWSVVLTSWGPINKASCASDSKDFTTVDVEDAEVIQDNLITKQSEKLEEETSPKQIAMEDIVDEEENYVKGFSVHHSKHKDSILETPTVPFDSVS